ncbi:MAG: DUF4349 domain-containing protein [Tepidisphaeraceae bacterium]
MNTDAFNLEPELAELDRHLSNLLAGDRPAPRFEADLLRRLHPALAATHRLRLHPRVLQSAGAIAAMLAIAATGYIGVTWMEKSISPFAMMKSVTGIDEARVTEAEARFDPTGAALHRTLSGRGASTQPTAGDSDGDGTVNAASGRDQRLPIEDVLTYPTEWPTWGKTANALDSKGVALKRGEAVTELGDADASVRNNTWAGNFGYVPQHGWNAQAGGTLHFYADSDLKGPALRTERYAQVTPQLGQSETGKVGTDRTGKDLSDTKLGASVNGDTTVAGTALAYGLQDTNTPADRPANEQLGRPVTPTQPAVVDARKIVRSGTVEFTVDNFDKSVATMSDVVQGLGGFVASTSSNKLENGRTAGSVMLRVPPDRLDALVAALKPIGELKKQNIAASDVTRQWTDLDGQLRAARTMEERLLKVIENGKGEVKDLVAAEHELGEWRTKIEQLTGELNVLNNQVSLSTLTVVLAEKDIAAPAVIRETEQLSAGVEVEDVVAARQKAIDAITKDAGGRIVQADLKQMDAGQFTSTIVADVAPDKVGALTDRLRQIGTVARLTSDRQQTQSGDVSPDAIAKAKVERLPSRITISLYNLANVQPRQTTSITLAPADVEKAYRALLEQVTKAGGTVLQSDLTGSDPSRAVATIRFDVPSSAADSIDKTLHDGADVVDQQTQTQPDVANTTAAKRGFALRLVSAASVPPRVTTRAAVRVASAEQSSLALQGAATQQGGRVIESGVSRDEQGRSTARVIVELPASKADAVLAGNVRGAGELLSFSTAQDARVPDGALARARFEVSYTTVPALVSNDEGIGASLRNGLSVSLKGLGWSASMLVVGLCLVAPWAIVMWIVWKLWRRGRRVPVTA